MLGRQKEWWEKKRMEVGRKKCVAFKGGNHVKGLNIFQMEQSLKCSREWLRVNVHKLIIQTNF